MMMTFPTARTGEQTIGDEIMARMPEPSLGDTEWVAMTARTSAEHLERAIASGQAYRVANALRAIAHSPTIEQLRDFTEALCDTIVSDPAVAHDGELISTVAKARDVAHTVIEELRGQADRDAADTTRQRETLDGFVRLVRLHDPRTADRMEAVGALSERIARTMGLTPADVLSAEMAGRLHDVGMVNVPPAILLKGNALSKKERDRINDHPIAGAAFVAGVPALAHLAPLLRSHHERYDGHGYPDGLAGEAIPVVSRVIAVADSFVDMVTDVPYREPMTAHDACLELSHQAGSQFDPDVVRTTLDLLDRRHRKSRTA